MGLTSDDRPPAGKSQLGRALTSRPRTVLILALALLAVSGLRLYDLEHHVPRFRVDPSMQALLPAAGEDIEVFRRATRLFDDDDLLFAVWLRPQTGDAASDRRLTALRTFTAEVRRLPGVSEVRSLATAHNISVDEDVTRIEPWLAHELTDSRAADALLASAAQNPLLRGRLVASDGGGVLTAIRFAPDLDSRAQIALLDAVRERNAHHAGDWQSFVTGPLPVRLAINRILVSDLYRVMPVAVFATFLVALVAFRSLRGVVLPLAGNLVAVALTLAVFVASGHALNFVTVILPPVIYVIGFAYAIHVVTEFDRHFTGDTRRVRAAARALDEVLLPLTLTALTTAIAFLALAISDIASIRIFGLYAALGVSLSWLGALTIVPAGLVLLPGAAQVREEQQRIDRYAGVLARIAARRRTLVLIIGVGFLVLAGLAATRVDVGTEVLRNFGDDHPVRAHFEAIGEHFAGAVPLRILVEADAVDGLKEPAALEAIDELATWLRAQPEVGGVYALSDYVRQLHTAIAPQAGTPLPGQARLVNHLLLVGGTDDQRLFVNRGYNASLIHVRTDALSTADLNRFAARVEQRLASLPVALDANLTGLSYLSARSVDDITLGQVKSLALAFLVVLVLLCVLFGSFRTGVFALVPNLLPVVGYFGLLGLTPITLNLTTSLVACAVFGIAIDDSVHFLSRFAQERRRRADNHAAVEATLGAVLRPVSLTTAALCVGFLALTVGELRSQVEFGWLAAVTLLTGWLVDIVFTPALCQRLPVRIGWQHHR